MNSTSLPNNLRAVLLCIRSRSGARIVFDYPWIEATDGIVQSPSGRDDGPEQSAQALSKPDKFQLDASNHTLISEQRGSSTVTTLGIKTDVLAKLLTPGRWSNRQKFEVTIGDLTFIGEPCHAHESGFWSSTASDADASGQTHVERPHAIEIREPEAQEQQSRDFTHVAESMDSGVTGQSLGTSLGSVSDRSGSMADGLLMFHVLFAVRKLDENDNSARLGSADIYEHFCQPLTRALKYLQQQYRYVEIESRKVLAAKVKPSNSPTVTNASEAVLQSSELAWAMKMLYESILTDQIASLTLHGNEMALQIPNTTSPLPLQATALHSALLLTEDKRTILRSLDSHPEAAAMSFFVTHLLPTKPLSKMAARLALPPSAVLFLAEHLIRWRKARLVAPLHVRNTYVVSPDAPLEKLSELSNAFNKKFPALPSLQKMLTILGTGRPMVYASCLPSRIHRDAFMEILAWLVCERLVIRLNTFGWLRLQLTPENRHTTIVDGIEIETLDDSSSTISDSGTAFRPDEKIPQVNYQAARILETTNLNAQEREAVVALRNTLCGVEVQDIFTVLLKHLDGEHAIEDVAIIEGLKRSKVEECLSMLDKLAVLQTFQCP